MELRGWQSVLTTALVLRIFLFCDSVFAPENAGFSTASCRWRRLENRARRPTHHAWVVVHYTKQWHGTNRKYCGHRKENCHSKMHHGIPVTPLTERGCRLVSPQYPCVYHACALVHTRTTLVRARSMPMHGAHHFPRDTSDARLQEEDGGYLRLVRVYGLEHGLVSVLGVGWRWVWAWAVGMCFGVGAAVGLGVVTRSGMCLGVEGTPKPTTPQVQTQANRHSAPTHPSAQGTGTDTLDRTPAHRAHPHSHT